MNESHQTKATALPGRWRRGKRRKAKDAENKVNEGKEQASQGD
ncbi:hypothetical protein [Klebsiella pneumoniae]|nr:hypothetical protein [Klebsiella pneumoniae]